MIPKTSGKIFCGLTRRKLNCFKALSPVTVGIKPTVFQQSSMVVVVWCSDLLYCFRLTSCRWCNHEFCFLPENQEGKYLAVSPWPEAPRTLRLHSRTMIRNTSVHLWMAEEGKYKQTVCTCWSWCSSWDLFLAAALQWVVVWRFHYPLQPHPWLNTKFVWVK